MGGRALLLAAVLTVAMQPAQAADCLRAEYAIPAGAIAKTDAFAPAACGTKSANPFRYDAERGVTVTAQALAPGEIVARYPEFGIAELAPGDTMELEARAGGVLVARKVEVMQRARPGQRVFVKAADDSILSVAYEDLSR